MKANKLYHTILWFLALSCILSCSSDDESNGDDSINFRVKEITETYVNSYSDRHNKSVLLYNNELLTEIIEYEREDSTWEEEYKSELIYEGEWVSVKDFEKEGGIWVEDQNWSIRMKIVNDRIEILEYSDDNQAVFNYSGDKLIAIQQFYDGESDFKIEFNYTGNDLQETIAYYYEEGSWKASMRYKLSYVDGKMMQIMSAYYDNESWQDSEKQVFTYSGNNIIKIEYYYWYNESWEPSSNKLHFEYNSDGLLITEREEYSDQYSYVKEYLYEEGRGNFKIFMGINYYNFSYPTPQKPSIKVLASETYFDKSLIQRFLVKGLPN